MKKAFLAAALLICVSSAAVRADTLGYNQNVAQNSGTGNLYFGTGNPNGDFATSTGSNGAVLGLRADIAFGSLIAGTNGGSGADNLYIVPAGKQATGGDAGDALWDFVFSVDVSGVSADTTLSNYTADLTVTAPGGATSGPIPIGSIPDNGGTTSIAQNAENISFGGGNPNLLGTYTFVLTLDDSSHAQVASDEMFVDVVPLPSAAGMGFSVLALAGVGLLLRKKRRLA